MWLLAKVILMVVGVASLMWIYTNLLFYAPRKIARASQKYGHPLATFFIFFTYTAIVTAAMGLLFFAGIPTKGAYGYWGIAVVVFLWCATLIGSFFYFAPADDILDIEAMIHSRDLNKRK